MGQKLAAYNTQGAIIGFYDSVDSPVPRGINTIEITDAQWQTCLSTSGYTVVSGVLVAPAAPTAAQLLTTAQTIQVAALSTVCSAAITAGFTSSALGSVYTYPFQTTDQQNLSDSVLASTLPGTAADWTTPFWCEDSTGTWAFVQHTVTQIQQVGKDAMASKLSFLTQNQTLATQVMAATTVAAVQAIVWTNP